MKRTSDKEVAAVVFLSCTVALSVFLIADGYGNGIEVAIGWSLLAWLGTFITCAVMF